MTPNQINLILAMTKERRQDYILQYRREHGEKEATELLAQVNAAQQARRSNQGENE